MLQRGFRLECSGATAVIYAKHLGLYATEIVQVPWQWILPPRTAWK